MEKFPRTQNADENGQGFSRPLPPLPQRAAPRPWEDLSSLLCRVTRNMGYPDPRWILHPQGYPYGIQASNLPLLSEPREYRLLQQLLLLDETTLYALTAHPFAAFLSDLPRSKINSHPLLSRHLFSTYFLGYPQTRVCPLCLEESPVYDRLYWRMKDILFCPLHRTRLRETCPRCSHAISSLRLDPFCCSFCQKGDYREPVSAPITQDHLFHLSTGLFLCALGIMSPQEEADLQQAWPGLMQHSPTHYFALLRQLRTAFSRAFPRQELLALLVAIDALSVDDVLAYAEMFPAADTAAFFLFHGLFLQWPDRFFHFLDRAYLLAVPPFLGQEQTAVVQKCQRLFADTGLQSAWQTHLQQYDADEKVAQETRIHMGMIMRQLKDFGSEHMQPQQVPLLTQAKQENTSLVPHIVPFPGESLASVVTRAALQLDLRSPEAFLRTAFSFHHLEEQNLLTLTDTSDYAFLEYLLHIEREILYHLTIHHFADLLQRGDRFVPVAEKYPSLERNAWAWLFPEARYTRVCPHCLAEEAYDRLYWMARPVLVCPYHCFRLVQACPSCKQKIPILRPSVFHCPFCSSGDYRHAFPVFFSKDHPLVISSALFLQSLGIPLPPSWQLPAHLVPSPLLEMNAKEYFRLLEQIAFEFLSNLPQHTLLTVCTALDKSACEGITQQESGESDSFLLAFLLFHLLFTAWPTRFSTGLDVLCRTIRVPPYQHFYYGFEQCQKYFWRFFGGPDFSWLQSAFEQYKQQFYQSTWYAETAKAEQKEMRRGGKSFF